MEPLEKYLRPEVAAFARLMEKRLRENDHKPGWKNDSAGDLFERVRDEVRELHDELVVVGGLVGREAADVANFAMMVADVCGALGEE